MKIKFILCLLFVPQLAIAIEQCAIKNPDSDGYLQAICEYIVENKIDLSPGHPDTYQIREIVKSHENSKELLLIYLNCCYLGDSATIDPETKKVTSFKLGAK